SQVAQLNEFASRTGRGTDELVKDAVAKLLGHNTDLQVLLTSLENSNSKCQQILKHSQIDLIDGWLAACELLGPEKFCPIIVCYLKKMSNVLDFLEPLVEEIKTITENLKVLGFKSRYVNNRLKSFGSVFRNWLPELAAGGYDQ